MPYIPGVALVLFPWGQHCDRMLGYIDADKIRYVVTFVEPEKEDGLNMATAILYPKHSSCPSFYGYV